MKDLGFIILIVGGAWLLMSGKLEGVLGAVPSGAPGELPGELPLLNPTGESKTTISEMPTVPLDVWQSLTREQLQGLPVTEQIGQVGTEKYYKTSTPIAIGDTGFKIWGMTESGATIVSMNPPETYSAWDWMH